MTPSRTIKPVDDARLTTGEELETTKIMVTFPAAEVVGIEINGGLVGDTSYHEGGRGRVRTKVVKNSSQIEVRRESSILLTDRTKRIEWSCL